MSKLTKAQRATLAATPDTELKMPSDWRATRVFLALYDLDLVEMRLRSRSDISCGPGYHGSDWMIRRTSKGRAALNTQGDERG